ncbi:MAG TPA: YciI family protein [Gemmatimonadales bacterium]|nr:YciI family protein [Gemmatimonadales bacterium]
MRYMLIIYVDPDMLNELPDGEEDRMMRDCLTHADELKAAGTLLESRMLATPDTAKAVRVRNRKLSSVDGPFAETKEVLGGFNIIEAADMDEAVRIASEFPWARTGCVEVRPVQDFDVVRRRVGLGQTMAGGTG